MKINIDIFDKEKPSPRFLMDEPILWERYQGGMCREVPPTVPYPGKFSDQTASSTSLNKMLMSGLGISTLYSHQHEILTNLNEEESEKDAVISLPFGAGKTTSILLAYLPQLISKGYSALILCPDSVLAKRQALLWEGALKKSNIGWLVDVVRIEKGGKGEHLTKALRPGCLVIMDYSALNELLLKYEYFLKEFATFQQAVILEDLENLQGPVAVHARYVIGRYKYLLARHKSTPQWISVLPEVKSPESFVSVLGVGGKAVTKENGAASSANKLSLWVPAIRDVDNEQRIEGSVHRVTPTRNSYWQESIDLASTSVLAGRVTAILSGEFQVTSADMTQISKDVQNRLNEVSEKELPDVSKLIFSGSDLSDLRRGLLEADLDLSDLQTLIFAGYGWPAKAISSEVKHLGLGSQLDTLLVFPRTPRYQYFLSRPDDLADFPGSDQESLRPLPDLGYNMPGASVEALGFHVNSLIAEWGREIDLTLLAETVPDDLLQGVKRFLQDDAAVEQNANSILNSPMAGFTVLSPNAFTVKDKNAAREAILTFVDKDNVAAEYYPGAIFVVNQRRYCVVEFDFENELVLVEESSHRQISNRISTMKILNKTPIGQPVEREGFSFGIWSIDVNENIVGKRTYQNLDFETESEPEIWGTSIERQFSAPALIIGFPEATERVSHSLSHLFRASIGVEQGIQQFKLQFFPNGRDILVFDDRGKSSRVVTDLCTEGAILDLLRRSWRILMDCPCSDDKGCPGCLLDWECPSIQHNVSKWDTLEFLAKTIWPGAELESRMEEIQQKKCVEKPRFLGEIVAESVRVLGQKVRADINDQFKASFWSDSTKALYAGAIGICDSGQKKIYIDRNMNQAKCQDVTIHEFFHNYQSEGNLSPRLKYYNRRNIDSSKNIPFQGKLFVEGSADWATIIGADFWGSRDRMLDVKRGASGEYLEGYRVMRYIQSKLGVVGALDFLKIGRGGDLDLNVLYRESSASHYVNERTLDLMDKSGELLCLSAAYREKENDIVVSSHYMARKMPIDIGGGLSPWQKLFWAISGRIKDMSLDDFFAVYEKFNSFAIVNMVLRKKYIIADTIPCLDCAGVKKERLEDACILHKGTGLLHGPLGVQPLLVASILSRPWLLFS